MFISLLLLLLFVYTLNYYERRFFFVVIEHAFLDIDTTPKAVRKL